MVMTYSEFQEVVHFAGELIYKAFYTLDQAKLFSDGGVQISILDIMVGFLALYLIVDRILIYFSGD